MLHEFLNKDAENYSLKEQVSRLNSEVSQLKQFLSKEKLDNTKE